METALAEPIAAPPSRPGRPARRRRRRRLLIAFVVMLALASVPVAAYGAHLGRVRVPEWGPLTQSTMIYYADGTTVLARLGDVRRTVIDTRALPEEIRMAFISAQDRHFYTGGPLHHPSAIARQYVRTLVDPQPRLEIAALALKVDERYSRDELLDRYLNTMYFGRAAYGIEAAAQAYFGKRAAALTVEEAMVLAGVLDSPGNGAYDPTMHPDAARQEWQFIKVGLVYPLGVMSPAQAAAMEYPTTVLPATPASAEPSAPARNGPTGLIVRHVLAELRQLPALRSIPDLENAGLRVVTTIDPGKQAALERYANGTVAGSVLADQPANLQAAAVAVEAKTGRVRAYYGGPEGAGADYAGFPGSGAPTQGAHPPGASFHPYVLAEALRRGASVKSVWPATTTRQFPRSGRDAKNPVRDSARCPTKADTCTLIDSTTAELQVPYFAVVDKLGVPGVLETARASGVDVLWNAKGEAVDLRSTAPADAAKSLSPEVALGQYPITVLDQANGMASFAGGVRASAHFVASASAGDRELYHEDASTTPLNLSTAQLADLTWTLAQNPAAKLASGRPSAAAPGTWERGPSAAASSASTAPVASASTAPGGTGGGTLAVGPQPTQAWMVGFTPELGVAVWVGNKAAEEPLRDRAGAPVLGTTLPADIYRGFLEAALAGVPIAPFPAPAFGGDINAATAIR